MVSSDKAIKHLGFTPRFTIEDGIQELANVVQSRRIKNADLARFSNVSAMIPLIGSTSP